MKDLKIAVTGGGGFLGQHLLSSLKGKNFSPVLFARRKHNLFEPKTLASFLEREDIVIHLAAANRASSLELLRVNTLGTLGLLEAISQYSPRTKLIFSSSSQVYLSEKNIYALSKRFAEELIARYVREGLLKEAIILRISNIYGPGCRPFYNSVIATLTHQIRSNKVFTVEGDGTQKRDYVYVEDAVSAMMKAIFYTPKNKIEFFDICSGKLSSLNEIIKILKKISSQKIKVEYNKKVKIKRGEIKKNYQKAKKYLDWKPKIGLKVGLSKTLRYYGT